jgi:two-component system sensor histidine kinase PilS (NtrC family)
VDSITAGLMTTDFEGRVNFFNEAASTIFAIPPAQAIGEKVTALLTEGDDFLERVKGKLVGRRYVRLEGAYLNRVGEEIYLGMSVSYLLFDGETRSGFLFTFQDLTEIKRLEREVRLKENLATMGEVAAGMAHEIRNPLASISGSEQLLLEEGGMSANDQRLLQIVLREAERLNLLLGDFLRFARPTPPTMQRLDLALIFDELIEVVKGDSRFTRIQFLKDYASAELLCDSGQLRQALLNLLINAAEALDGVGTIRLHADTDPVSLRIEDSGPGLLPEAKNQLFNPFFTTKENGTGLGLAIVHAIISAHGGKIDVDKSSLGGAAFILTFGASQH